MGNVVNFRMRFIILVTGWNCKGYVRPCYRSLINQSHQDFVAVFISDGPTDGADRELRECVTDPRCHGRIYKDNVGAAKRRYDALQEFGRKTDVVLLLGMDDQLLPGALERIATEYAAGKWMTYGNWKDQRGKMLPDGFLDFDDATHETRDYRKVTYRSTAPNTFYKFLFDHIPAADFQLNGKWIDSTTESEVMFSCLELCGKERIGVITDPIYYYNSKRPNGTLARHGTEYKYSLLKQITERPKRELLSPNQFGK